MGDHVVFKRIHLTNVLSFGPDSGPIDLRSLNVIIGPNTAGKSNLLEAFRLLKDSRIQWTATIARAGGIHEWIWKGSTSEAPTSQIEVVMVNSDRSGDLMYRLSLGVDNDHTRLVAETIESVDDDGIKLDWYRHESGQGPSIAYVVDPPGEDVTERQPVALDEKLFDASRSIMAHLKDPLRYKEITHLGNVFDGIRIYENFQFPRSSSPRAASSADLPRDFLLEDGSNLALVLQHLESLPEPWARLTQQLKRFSDSVDRLSIVPRNGYVEFELYERDLQTAISAHRMSDGMLRFLCLLSILCHPKPPSLVCIEEPEIGLHPDAVRLVAELLIEASQRMQLIVTTHSDLLVSSLDETPESLLVCEKDDTGTHFRRLPVEQTAVWLEKYSLGDLWLKGEIGGTRW